VVTEQLSLFDQDEPDTFATPTKRSACRVAARVAKKCGYDYVACCRWCDDGVRLTGEWRRERWDQWVHDRTGQRRCLRSRRRRGIWRMKEDGGCV
jgi:hypothetical protein